MEHVNILNEFPSPSEIIITIKIEPTPHFMSSSERKIGETMIVEFEYDLAINDKMSA